MNKRKYNLNELINKDYENNDNEYVQPINTIKSNSKSIQLELNQSKKVLINELLKLFNLTFIERSSFIVISGLKIPSFTSKLKASLSEIELKFLCSTLTQILFHISNYLNLPLPFNMQNVFTSTPIMTLGEVNRVLLPKQIQSLKIGKYTLPSSQALCLLLYNLCFVLHISGFKINDDDDSLQYILINLCNLSQSPHLGSKAFGPSSSNPLRSFTSFQLPLQSINTVLNNIHNNGNALAYSSSNESTLNDKSDDDQWSLIEND